MAGPKKLRFSGNAIKAFGGKCEVCGTPMRKHTGWIDIDPGGRVVDCSNGRPKR